MRCLWRIAKALLLAAVILAAGPALYEGVILLRVYWAITGHGPFG